MNRAQGRVLSGALWILSVPFLAWFLFGLYVVGLSARASSAYSLSVFIGDSVSLSRPLLVAFALITAALYVRAGLK